MNMATSTLTTPLVWGDDQPRKETMAEKLKRADAKMNGNDLAARAAKFETSDKVDFNEIIIYFHKKFEDITCV